nr:tail fiber protein [Salmonella enterica]
MGEGSALPVGVPVPWPSATLPEGWLKCNGAAFSSEMYPKLAKAYPANKLPDLRGEFIRGWDDGRGIDAARALLSIQNGMLEKHRHIVVANDGYDTKDEWELATIFKKTYTQGRGLDATNTGGSLIPSPTLHSRGSIGNTGGSETRPSLYIDLCNCLILICSIQHQMKVNLWTKNSYRLWLTNWPKTSKPLKTSVSLIGC